MHAALPNLIIPGAPKAGTSSICEYISNHPEVFVPSIKEPRYFISQEIKALPDRDPLKKYLIRSSCLSEFEYRKIYDKTSAKIRVDSSVQYMFYHQAVIPRIKSLLGDPYIFICLRNPVDRAFSNFMYASNFEDKFELEIAREQEKINCGLNSFHLYVTQGFYYEQVRHYMSEFSRVKIVLFEDIKENTGVVVSELFDFLNLADCETDTRKIYNKSGKPKNAFLDYLIFKDNVLKQLLRPVVARITTVGNLQKLMLKLKSASTKKSVKDEMSCEIRNALTATYKNDILKLQDLIQCDLTNWIKES